MYLVTTILDNTAIKHMDSLFQKQMDNITFFCEVERKQGNKPQETLNDRERTER